MQNILVVEDDIALGKGIAMALGSEQMQVEQCHCLLAAKEYLAVRSVDLVILDINLPDGSGLNLLRDLRHIKNTAVILLTANDTEVDIVNGLESGADDYMTKPFSLSVLRARVNAQLRKLESRPSSFFQQDSFRFCFGTMEFMKDRSSIELSKTEQKLLRILVENRGLTMERGRLIDRIWTDGATYVDENALSVTIKRLRDKLEDQPSHPRYIKTVYGIGYKWAVKECEKNF